MNLEEWLKNALHRLEGQNRRRILRPLTPVGHHRVMLDGREVLLFSSNDYLGLSNHPRVREAMALAAKSLWQRTERRLIDMRI